MWSKGLTLILINEAYCPKSHKCPVLRICPTEAITQKDIFSPPEIDQSKCTNCGECASECNVFQLERKN